MKKIVSCKFNLDTACVEVRYSDSSKLCIYTPGVDDVLYPGLVEQTEMDWLIYNDPVTYVNLVLSGELESYVKEMAGTHGLQD